MASLEAVLLYEISPVGAVVNDQRAPRGEGRTGPWVDRLDARLAPARAAAVVVLLEVADWHDVHVGAVGHLPPRHAIRAGT